MAQIASTLGVAAQPADTPQDVARRAGSFDPKQTLALLNRGELQKLCEHMGIDRNGAVYDQDLIEKLLKA
jgi:hypothetical protein